MNRPRRFVAALVLALIVVAGPVGAAHLVVVSVHETHTDFEGATLTNMSIDGAGTSATVNVDGRFSDNFEQDAADAGVPDNWETGTLSTDDASVTTAQAYEGSQSYLDNNPDNTVQGIRPANQPITATTEDATVAIRATSGASADEASFRLDEGGARRILVGIRSGDLMYYDGAWKTASTTPNSKEWVLITVTNINAGSDTYDVEWQVLGGASGTETGLSMDGNMASGYDSTYLKTFDNEGYFDAVDVPDGEELPAEYLHNHSVADTRGGFVNITTSSDVTTTVTWRGDSNGDGNYDTLLNQTTGITTTGNKSFTWSEFSGGDVRVNVTVESTGANSAFDMTSEGVKQAGVHATPTPTPSVGVDQGENPLFDVYVSGEGLNTQFVNLDSVTSAFALLVGMILAVLLYATVRIRSVIMGVLWTFMVVSLIMAIIVDTTLLYFWLGLALLAPALPLSLWEANRR